MAKKTRSLAIKAAAPLVVLALAVAACGGASPDRPANSPADQSAPGAGQPSVAPESDSQKGAPPEEAPSTQPAAPTASGGASPDTSSVQAQIRSARRDVQLATRDLDSSMGDCANVCRALSSLERATAHLCALASGDSDKSACDDAKSRVTHAQAQIKASCGTCANGASLDSK